jgi:hypothetical protein
MDDELINQLAFSFLILILILLIISVQKTAKAISYTKAIMADIIIIISTSFGTIALYYLLLILKLEVTNKVTCDFIFFGVITIVTLIAAFQIYFKEQGEGKFKYFLSEILLSYGIALFLVGLVNIYLEVNPIPKEIMEINYHNNQEVDKIIGTSYCMIILIISSLLIIASLWINFYRK